MDVIGIARETREALAAAPKAGRTARLAEIARSRELGVPTLRRILEGADFLEMLARSDPDLAGKARTFSPALLSALRAALLRDEAATREALVDHFAGRAPLLVRHALAMGARPRDPVPASARSALSAVGLEVGQALAGAFRAALHLRASLYPAHERGAPRPAAYILEAYADRSPYGRDNGLERFARTAYGASRAAPAAYAVLPAPARVRDEAARVACRDQFWIALGVATRFAGAVLVVHEARVARVQIEALLDEAGVSEPVWYLCNESLRPRQDPSGELEFAPRYRLGTHWEDCVVVFGRPVRGYAVPAFPEGVAMTMLAPSLILLALVSPDDVLTGGAAGAAIEAHRDGSRLGRAGRNR